MYGMLSALWKKKEILEELGGLPTPIVTDQEWLLLFKEDVRNSVQIEGFNVDDRFLEKIILGGRPGEECEEAYRYFKTAGVAYKMAYECYKKERIFPGVSLARYINKELGYSGELRTAPVAIAGSDLKPPVAPVGYLDEWLSAWFFVVQKGIKEGGPQGLALVLVSHGLFERLQPFFEGNGRTGRILLNCALINMGLPLAVVKARGKRRYFQALEEMDEFVEPLFSAGTPSVYSVMEVVTTLERSKLVNLLAWALGRSLDRMIMSMVNEELVPVGEILKELGCKPETFVRLLEEGKIVAVQGNGNWYTTRGLVRKLLFEK